MGLFELKLKHTLLLYSLFYFILYCSGADPGFFLGGCAPLRNGITDVFFFLHNTSCIRKPQVISGVGGWGGLHPPPRSALVVTSCKLPGNFNAGLLSAYNLLHEVYSDLKQTWKHT